MRTNTKTTIRNSAKAKITSSNATAKANALPGKSRAYILKTRAGNKSKPAPPAPAQPAANASPVPATVSKAWSS